MVITITSMFGALVALATASQAGAEAAPDWEQARSEDGAVIALSRYDNGLAIGVRCSRGTLEAMIAGLPDAERRRRPLRLSFNGRAYDEENWFVSSDKTIAYYPFPGLLARRLRLGGAMRIGVPGAGANGANLVYAVDLPRSQAAIDNVLTACDRPLVDPHDAEVSNSADGGLPSDLRWINEPPNFTLRSMPSTGAFASVVCLAQPDGSLSDCQVETQYPSWGDFGGAAVRSMSRARVGTVDGQPMRTRRVATYFTYMWEHLSPDAVSPSGASQGSLIRRPRED